MTDTTPVTCRVLDVKPMGAGKIALAAAELVIDGVALTLHGLQVERGRQAGAEATTVTLPRDRTQAGDWPRPRNEGRRQAGGDVALWP